MRDGTIAHGPGAAGRRAGHRGGRRHRGRARGGRARRRTTWCCSTSTTARATWSTTPTPRSTARRSCESLAPPLRPGGVLAIWSAAEAPELRGGDDRGVRRGRGAGARRAAAGPRGAVLALRRAGTVGDMTDDDVRIEHDSMGEVQVPREALWRAQTQRAVENFPISGTPDRAGPDPRARPGQGRRGRRQRRARRARRRSRPHAIVDGRRRGRRRRARRRVPDRRLPDRVRHQLQHERQRGHRHARRPGRRRGAPQRPRQRQPVEQRHLPDRDPRRRDPGRRRRPAAGARRPRRQPGGARRRSSPAW